MKIAFLEMNQGVAAENQVSWGEPLPDHVEAEELPTRRGPGLSTGLDECRDHVDSDVALNGVGQWPGPVEVAARDVEQSLDFK
jgi:hypothetical protein